MPIEQHMIISYLIDHPGSTAREIARYLGVEKTEVNSCLYKHPNDFGSVGISWFVRNPVVSQEEMISQPQYEETDPVLLKLQNRDSAAEFSVSDFETLVGSNPMISPGSLIPSIEFEIWCGPWAGSQLSCDSNLEVKMLKYLQENDIVLAVGGQTVCVPYDTSFRSDIKYFPDIILLTRDCHIAFIEVKPAESMSYHKNLKKYEALADFCKRQGYAYMMIDPDNGFMTVEELKELPVIPELLQTFNCMEREKQSIHESHSEKPYLYFDKDDVKCWYNNFGRNRRNIRKKDFILQIHSLIINYGWYNLFWHGFRTYSRPVRIDRDHNVIGWR